MKKTRCRAGQRASATGKSTLAAALTSSLRAALLDIEPPEVPHLALDAFRPTAALVCAVLGHLCR